MKIAKANSKRGFQMPGPKIEQEYYPSALYQLAWWEPVNRLEVWGHSFGGLMEAVYIGGMRLIERVDELGENIALHFLGAFRWFCVDDFIHSVRVSVS